MKCLTELDRVVSKILDAIYECETDECLAEKIKEILKEIKLWEP